MTAEEKRKLLDEFCGGKLDVEELAEKAPECGCESAATVAGGHGPISDDELLRLFLTSRVDLDIKDRPSFVNRRPFKPVHLKKAYKTGLSVYRLAHASRDEIKLAAQILYKNRSEKEGDYGGILGVVDFPAKAVRNCAKEITPMCVLDTPLDSDGNNGFRRPSHADITNSKPGMSPEQQKISREIIFNNIQQLMTQTNADDLRDCDIREYLPVVVKD